MIIPLAHAYRAAGFAASSGSIRQEASNPPAYFADIVSDAVRQARPGGETTASTPESISQASRAPLPAESADSHNLTSPISSFLELVRKNPGMVMPCSEARMEEHKLWEVQKQAREDAISRYAQEHPAKIYGQVVINGELVATVWDSGMAQTPGPMPGLSSSGSSPEELAKARLREIAEALGGEIRYSGFLPLPGGASEYAGAVIPESFLASLPPITARPFTELDAEQLAIRQRWEEEYQRKYGKQDR